MRFRFGSAIGKSSVHSPQSAVVGRRPVPRRRTGDVFGFRYSLDLDRVSAVRARTKSDPRMDARPPFDPHELEKRDAALLAGLRAALAGDEHRLYRSGKFDGLFPSKTGLVGEAAGLAIREGLLEYA